MMLEEKKDRSALYRRLRLYGFGVLLGVILSYFLLFRGRDLGFWTPGNRVLEKLRLSEIVYTENAECKLQCLNVSKGEIRKLFDSTEKVDLDSSNVHGKCPIYIIRGKGDNDLKVTVSTCDSTANILEIKRTTVKDTCHCN